MQRNFKNNLALAVSFTERRESAVSRLRAAIDSLDRENRMLQDGVSELQDVIGELRAGFETLAESADGYRTNLAAVRTAPLRRTARRLEAIADDWLTRGRDIPGAPPGRDRDVA